MFLLSTYAFAHTFLSTVINMAFSLALWCGTTELNREVLWCLSIQTPQTKHVLLYP